MARLSRKEQLKGKLTANQQKAVYLLVENEMLETSERRNMDEIAHECGVERMSLYRWRTQNDNFIEYKNLVADDYLSTDRERVYAVLQKMIFSKQPSVKALDLYFKRFGLLSEKVTVENVDNGNSRTQADIDAQIAELDALIDEE